MHGSGFYTATVFYHRVCGIIAVLDPLPYQSHSLTRLSFKSGRTFCNHTSSLAVGVVLLRTKYQKTDFLTNKKLKFKLLPTN